MNYNIILFLLFLARIFTRLGGFGLCRLSFMNNTKSLYILLGPPKPWRRRLWPLWPKKLLNPCNPWLKFRVLRELRGETKKNKTKPIQTQNKPNQSQFFGGFWRKNFNFSLKIDDTKLNFLCKTKPIYTNLSLSMSFQKTLNMQNEPNLHNILTYLTNEIKRTYSDFCKKDVKKTNPILTKS